MKKVMFNDNQLSGSFGQENLPIGAIIAYGGANPPIGFLLCNGSNVSRTLYADLFNAIGTAYGEGDGTTTFTLPDWRDRVPMGASENYELGEKGGEAEHTLTINEMPSHSHSNRYKGGSGVNWGYDYTNGSSTQSGATPDSGGIGYTGGGQPHNNLQPFQTCNYIIKYCKSVSPAQEAIIDDNNIRGNTTWSSLRIKNKIETWIDITSQVTVTDYSSSVSHTYTIKKILSLWQFIKM